MMKNYKFFARLFAVIGIIFLILGFCFMGISIYKDKSTNFKLQIIETNWDQSGKINSSVRVFEGNQNDTIYLKGFGGEITFEIVQVLKDSIVIQTNRSMSLRNNIEDEIDLSSQDTKFTIFKGSFIILDTITMDAGASYRLELE